MVRRGWPAPTVGGDLRELAKREGAYFAHLLPPAADWLVAWRDAGADAIKVAEERRTIALVAYFAASKLISNAAVRFTPTVASHLSRPNSSTSPNGQMPALFTRMSIEPRRRTHSPTT